MAELEQSKRRQQDVESQFSRAPQDPELQDRKAAVEKQVERLTRQVQLELGTLTSRAAEAQSDQSMADRCRVGILGGRQSV